MLGFLIQSGPMLVIFAAFYFLFFRPLKKKANMHKKLVASLRLGDEIVTEGGLYGTIVAEIDEKSVVIQCSSQTRLRIARSSVEEVAARTPLQDRSISPASEVDQIDPSA